MPQISIVIPVYNVEKYLPQCLDSILAQTFTDWECILVNDGSKDCSGSICDQYATRDSRFRVFHKENGGVSSARNLGLQYIRGQWLCFVDSDDYVLPDYLQNLYAVSEGTQLVLGGYECFDCSARRFSFEEKKVLHLTSQDVDADSMLRKALLFLPSSKLFLVSIIQNKAVCFDEFIRLAEDTCFFMSYYTHIDTVAITTAYDYRYRIASTKQKYLLSPQEFSLHILKLNEYHTLFTHEHDCNLYPEISDIEFFMFTCSVDYVLNILNKQEYYKTSVVLWDAISNYVLSNKRIGRFKKLYYRTMFSDSYKGWALARLTHTYRKVKSRL